MNHLKLLCAFYFVATIMNAQTSKTVYSCKDGKINFKSDAPMEIIQASSDKVSGNVDVTKRTFAFSVHIRSFEGFNVALQREHFNENYMESEKFPSADFHGKIIEDVDLSKDGIYSVRAKGNFTIHGVEQERIIKATVKVQSNVIHITSKFTVLLKEHNIKIPKVVNEKVASEVVVDVDAEMK